MAFRLALIVFTLFGFVRLLISFTSDDDDDDVKFL